MADSLLDANQPSITRDDIIAKWKDKPQEELLAAKAESDLYIETLKARFDDLSKDFLEIKDQQKTGAQLKDLLDRLDNPPQKTEDSPTTDGQLQPGMKPEDIQKLIASEIAANQRMTKQDENFRTIQSRLKEHYGSDYASAYQNQLDTLQLSKEFADELARNHPSVFIKTFGLESQQTANSTSIPRNTQRPSFKPNAPKRDWNYYQEMKKSNPRMYLDPKIAVQMHDDAVALGDAFGMPQD